MYIHFFKELFGVFTAIIFHAHAWYGEKRSLYIYIIFLHTFSKTFAMQYKNEYFLKKILIYNEDIK